MEGLGCGETYNPSTGQLLGDATSDAVCRDLGCFFFVKCMYIYMSNKYIFIVYIYMYTYIVNVVFGSQIIFRPWLFVVRTIHQTRILSQPEEPFNCRRNVRMWLWWGSDCSHDASKDHPSNQWTNKSNERSQTSHMWKIPCPIEGLQAAS